MINFFYYRLIDTCLNNIWHVFIKQEYGINYYERMFVAKIPFVISRCDREQRSFNKSIKELLSFLNVYRYDDRNVNKILVHLISKGSNHIESYNFFKITVNNLFSDEEFFLMSSNESKRR